MSPAPDCLRAEGYAPMPEWLALLSMQHGEPSAGLPSDDGQRHRLEWRAATVAWVELDRHPAHQGWARLGGAGWRLPETQRPTPGLYGALARPGRVRWDRRRQQHVGVALVLPHRFAPAVTARGLWTGERARVCSAEDLQPAAPEEGR